MVAAWGLLLKKSFAEKETLKPNIPIPEFDGRYKQKQTNFSKANLLLKSVSGHSAKRQTGTLATLWQAHQLAEHSHESLTMRPTQEVVMPMGHLICHIMDLRSLSTDIPEMIIEVTVSAS